MTAALLLGAIAVDLFFVVFAARPSGFSRVIGPLHIRLHDPSTPLLIVALLVGSLVAVGWRTRARGWALAATALIATLAAAIVTRQAEKMFPIGDIAVIELYVRNAVAGRLLVGPYSRFGWHHPGPLYFYVLAPFYAWSQAGTASLAVGSTLIGVTALSLFIWTAARTLGARTSAVLLAAVVFYLCRVPGLTVSAWNPHVVVLPTLALVVLAAAAVGGDLMLLPLVALLVSLIVQTDVALAPVAVALAAAALASGVLASRRSAGRLALRSLNIAAWITLALWLVPLAEEAAHSPGNMTLLWRFFVGAHGAGQTFQAAGSAWAVTLMAPFGASLTLARGATFEAGAVARPAVISVIELVLLGAVAWRRWAGDRPLARLALVSLGASLVALWSVTRIEDRIMDHEVFWISALGVLNVGILLAAAASSLATRVQAQAFLHIVKPGLVHGALVGAAIAICLSQAGRAREGRLPATATSPVVERLAGSVRQYLEIEGAHKPLVKVGQESWGMAAGVLLETDRGSIPFAIEKSWMPMFPQSFAANGQEDAEIAFGNGDEHLRWTTASGGEPIASFPPLYIDGLPYTTR